MSVPVDLVHWRVRVPPKRAIADFVGMVKGRTAIRRCNKFPHLKRKPDLGNLFLGKR